MGLPCEFKFQGDQFRATGLEKQLIKGKKGCTVMKKKKLIVIERQGVV